MGALIQKIHHSITDGVGGVKMAIVLLDLGDRDPATDDGPMPDAPVAERGARCPRARLWDGVGHVQRRQLGILRRSPDVAARALRQALSDPARAVRDVVETAASVGRALAPATQPLSPIMTGRSLSARYATIDRSLDDLKRAAKAAGGKLNDAFLAAVAGGLHRYHLQAGVARRRSTDVDAGEHPRPTPTRTSPATSSYRCASRCPSPSRRPRRAHASDPRDRHRSAG